MSGSTGLGGLCKGGHDAGDGCSGRYLVDGVPIGNCVVCGREANRARKASQRKARAKLAKEQGWDDGKYYGTPCRRRHDGERYVLDGGCVQCDCERRRARRDPSKDKVRKKTENRIRAQKEFSYPDLKHERGEVFDRRSELLKLRKGISR